MLVICQFSTDLRNIAAWVKIIIFFAVLGSVIKKIGGYGNGMFRNFWKIVPKALRIQTSSHSHKVPMLYKVKKFNIPTMFGIIQTLFPN